MLRVAHTQLNIKSKSTVTFIFTLAFTIRRLGACQDSSI